MSAKARVSRDYGAATLQKHCDTQKYGTAHSIVWVFDIFLLSARLQVSTHLPTAVGNRSIIMITANAVNINEY